MQRLHVDDLSGILIEQGWPKLVLPAIAVEAADYQIGGTKSIAPRSKLDAGDHPPVSVWSADIALAADQRNGKVLIVAEMAPPMIFHAAV